MIKMPTGQPAGIFFWDCIMDEGHTGTWLKRADDEIQEPGAPAAPDESPRPESNGSTSGRIMVGSHAPDAVSIVREHMAEHDLEVRFDGEIVRRDAMASARTAADIQAVLDQEEMTEETLLDDVMLRVRRDKLKLPEADIKRAIRKIKRDDQKARKMVVLQPLYQVLDAVEHVRAEQTWRRFVGTVFDVDVDLGIAVLKKFIWQVKRKALGLPIARHLISVWQSPIQGSGKTTAVLAFLSPLKELRTEPALLSDFVDKRSGDLYRYPVVFLDDMEKIDRSLIPTLNSLVTGEGLVRRVLGTSNLRKRRQMSTLIGTANKPVAEIIQDETGNRRFFTLPFRNGEVGKGGDPLVWLVVNDTDFDLLWRSVDAFGPDPTDPYLDALFAAQESTRLRSPVEEWLLGLDLKSSEVQAITTTRGVRAGGLFDLYIAQTASDISQRRFGDEIAKLAELSRGPFLAKTPRTDSGYFYPLRSRV
jgi:hypothetical protein